jgi:hypothetical protein
MSPSAGLGQLIHDFFKIDVGHRGHGNHGSGFLLKASGTAQR